MIIQALMEDIGISIPARNLLTEYHLPNGQSAHKPLQILSCNECADRQIIEHVRQQLKEQGCDLYALIEVVGDYQLDELDQMLNTSNAHGAQLKVLYFDYKKSLL